MSDKFRPTLDSNLVEGLLAECISQIKMSLDCCNEWQKSNMTLAQNVSATKTITRDEVWNVLDVTQYHTSKTLRPKHWMFIERLRRYHKEESSITLGNEPGETEDHVKALKLIVKLLGDAHLILHENTPENIREYLTYGGEIKELKKRGAIYKSPVRLASKRKVAKRSGGKNPSRTSSNDSGGVRERGEGSDSGGKARSNGKNYPPLERIGGLAAVDSSNLGRDSGEGEGSNRAEDPDLGDRSDSGGGGSTSEAQSSDFHTNGNDERGTSKGNGVSERRSVQATASDQGSIGDRKERVVFGPENLGLGRPGEDFDDGYLRSLERHGNNSREESSAYRGEVLAMKADLLEMIEGLQSAVEDLERFERGNDAAGRRVRKVCSEVAKSCKGIRVSVQEIRNHRKS